MAETLTGLIASTDRVLVLAPHPDDFDAIGVTLRYLHTRGNPIFVAVVSGSMSGVLDDFCGSDPEKKRLVREKEQRDSVQFFGLPDSQLAFLRLPEDSTGDPLEDEHSETVIRQHIAEVRPDIVFLPHGNDTNVGHRRVYAIFRRIAVSSDCRLTAYYVRDPKTKKLRTDLYMGFDEDSADWKRRLLLHHRSQQDRNLKLRNHGFDDRILNVNSDIARDLAVSEPYAEAFEIEEFAG
jgi:LmbE family N-acetylglucosaminyl deacetylase